MLDSAVLSIVIYVSVAAAFGIVYGAWTRSAQVVSIGGATLVALSYVMLLTREAGTSNSSYAFRLLDMPGFQALTVGTLLGVEFGVIFVVISAYIRAK